MQGSLSNNYFELFGLDETFLVDQELLADRYRQLQKEFHPDKFASKSDSERRWSVQAASLINEAFQSLRNDLSRAIYILGLNNISVDEETDTRMSPSFLMEQMEMRESLETIPSSDNPLQKIDAMQSQLKQMTRERYSQFNEAVKENDWTSGREVVRQWQFLIKMNRELKSLEEELDQ